MNETIKTEKAGASQKSLNIMDCELAFAVPSESSIIDCINPATNRSWIEGETLDEIRLRYPGAEIVDIEQWSKDKALRQDSPIVWGEVTSEKYREMLEVLPPADYNRGFSAFLVGEPSDHHATNGQPRYEGYQTRNGRFFASNRPMTRKEFRSLTR